MSEIINIEIKADQTGADEALKKVNKSLKEGTEAAEALNHVLDGDLAGAFKSLGELSKTLGINLGLAFSPAEIIAFVQVIAEVADKLSKLIADTFIYTDAMKEQDKALRTANKSLEDNAARVKALERATQLAAAQGAVAKEKLRLAFTLEDLGGNPEALREKLQKATKDFSDFSANVVNATTREGQVKALKRFGLALDGLVNPAEMRSKLAELENSVLALKSALEVAEAETKKTGQTIKNDLAAGADGAAKDKKKEQDALDAWVAHAVHSRGTLTEAVKRMAKEQEQADIDANLALAKSEEARIAKINADEQAAAEKERERQDEVYKGAIEVAKLASDKKIQLIEQDFERGKINQQQEIAAIAQEKERELEIEKLTQQKRWALWDGDKKKQQEVQNQIDKIIAQSKLVQTKAVTDGLKAQEQQYRQVFSQIGNAFKTEILGMIQGTETVAQAFAKMFNSLIGSFADYVAQKAEKRAEDWALDLLDSYRKREKNAADASSDANAGAASTLSDVPYPLNIPASIEVLGIGEAYAGGAMSSAGGDWRVDSDRLNFVHKNETILPAGIAGKLRDMVESGSQSGGVTVVVNHSVNAVDAASFQGHIRRHSNMIANEVTRALKRKGAR